MLVLGNEQKDRLVSLLAGKSLGLITNPTGVDHSLRHTVHKFRSWGLDLAALFGPEHGVFGDLRAGEPVQSTPGTPGTRNPETGLPVHSLYGATKKPSKEMLQGLDALVIDMQDVGLRFYTYLYTMALAMEAAAEQGLEFIVLDRPNPLGGELVEGMLLKEGHESFVGMYPLPARYALTIGEFAHWVQKHYLSELKLHVVKMEGWSRRLLWPDMDLVWVPPSPNLPDFESCKNYIGNVLFEGCNLSEGRGTCKPFSWIGAPWLDGEKLCQSVRKLQLAEILVRPVYFTPSFSKHEGLRCAGIEFHAAPANKTAKHMLRASLYLLGEIRKLHPADFRFSERPKIRNGIREQIANHVQGDQRLPFVSLLFGASSLYEGLALPEILAQMEGDEQEFLMGKEKYHLYS